VVLCGEEHWTHRVANAVARQRTTTTAGLRLGLRFGLPFGRACVDDLVASRDDRDGRLRTHRDERGADGGEEANLGRADEIARG
jgi:hypothetical protein